jgi:hypothetical protein
MWERDSDYDKARLHKQSLQLGTDGGDKGDHERFGSCRKIAQANRRRVNVRCPRGCLRSSGLLWLPLIMQEVSEPLGVIECGLIPGLQMRHFGSRGPIW